ncbi:hypothetical protein DEO72_LG8g2232 [Vigna unguiculata]|uniref:Nucleic acid-binding n=1 Tax=Vigna unguiculata TaxID=3917 RepID=A0A4D6MVS8_VIGUN|nr:hypothetical protein DEO72_LG8g2232 [Vigna unguiculata]
MARKLDLIKDIDDKKETLKLAVRVKDLWFVQNRDNSRHMELILLDQKSKNVVFHIRDMSSAVIGCTLWDSYYFKFMSNWRGEPDSYLLVVLLTQAKIKPCSALELMNKMIEVDGEDDPKCFPEDLDALLGCTLAFKVRVQPSNRSSFVMKASSNPETIASIRSKLDPKMIKDNSGEGTCDSSPEENSKDGPEIEEVILLIMI